MNRKSLSRQISDKIEDLISSGTYQVGEKLPTEQELMELFQVSRNTVREAIQSLAWAGLLEVRQGDGTYILSENRLIASIEQRCPTVSNADLSEARDCIEITIAHLAAKRRTENDLEKMHVLLQKRRDLDLATKEHTKADIDFHMAIAQACHNQVLTDMYTSMIAHLEGHVEERSAASDFSCTEIDLMHEQLFLSIKNGDADTATHSVEKILQI